MAQDTRDFQTAVAFLDLRGSNCPLPVLHCRAALQTLPDGGVLRLIASDRSARHEIPLLVRQLGHELLSFAEQAGRLHFTIRKLNTSIARRGRATNITACMSMDWFDLRAALPA